MGISGCYSEGNWLQLSAAGSPSCGLLDDELVVRHLLANWTGQLLLD